MTVRDKRVLITGSTGGLGPHLVEAFLAMGAQVVAVGRRRTALDDLRAGLGHHERLDVAECDVAAPEGVEALFDSVERSAPLDAVVHAVGAFRYGDLSSLVPAEVRAVVDANVVASALVTREAVARMAPRAKGAVVLVAADRALEPAAGFSVYGAAKAAVVHLARAVALEARPHGVRVNAVLPGTLDTPENRAAMPDSDPAGWARPEAVARAALWLASADAEGVSGSLVVVPGS